MNHQDERLDAWYDGSAICLIAVGAHGDPLDLGDEEADGVCSYLLSNGQVDEYPEAWCVEVEHCQRAFVAFFRTGGAQPAGIAWEAD